jgi:YVTN family beta-propeller protein
LRSGYLIFDVATQKATEVEATAWGERGAGRIAINGNTAYITNQMTSSVSMVDIVTAKVVRTFQVDVGPRDVAVDAAKNQLIVLCAGIGVIDVVDLGSYTVTGRIDAGLTKKEVTWSLPTVTSISPNKGAIGSTFTITITGMNLQDVKNLNFDFMGRARRLELEDPNIKVSNVQVKSDGAQVTATIQILKDAVEGQRMIRLITDEGETRPPFAMTLFTVTK